MFQVSQAAAEKLFQTRRDRGLPETTGVRVFSEPEVGGGVTVRLAFANVPSEDDTVLDESGMPVFVSPEVERALSEVVLDLQPTEEGPALVFTHAGGGETQ